MTRDVKWIFGVIATPVVIWCLVTFYFIIRSHTDRGMKVQSNSHPRTARAVSHVTFGTSELVLF